MQKKNNFTLSKIRVEILTLNAVEVKKKTALKRLDIGFSTNNVIACNDNFG